MLKEQAQISNTSAPPTRPTAKQPLLGAKQVRLGLGKPEKEVAALLTRRAGATQRAKQKAGTFRLRPHPLPYPLSARVYAAIALPQARQASAPCALRSPQLGHLT